MGLVRGACLGWLLLCLRLEYVISLSQDFTLYTLGCFPTHSSCPAQDIIWAFLSFFITFWSHYLIFSGLLCMNDWMRVSHYYKPPQQNPLSSQPESCYGYLPKEFWNVPWLSPYPVISLQSSCDISGEEWWSLYGLFSLFLGNSYLWVYFPIVLQVLFSGSCGTSSSLLWNQALDRQRLVGCAVRWFEHEKFRI